MTARVSNRFGYAAISIYASMIVAAVIVAYVFGDRILAGSIATPDLADVRTGSVRIYDERQRNCTQLSYDNVSGGYSRAPAQPCDNAAGSPRSPAAVPTRDEMSSFESIKRAFRGR